MATAIAAEAPQRRPKLREIRGLSVTATVYSCLEAALEAEQAALRTDDAEFEAAVRAIQAEVDEPVLQWQHR